MQDETTQLYTLSEVARIVGVEEKTLHLYAHKGLIDPNLLTDSAPCFTKVDCARLKIIKRALEIGYEAENIFNLIGTPEDVLNAENPLSACRRFATERYKQIFDELGTCEPLEQINKKCDLKLLKNYIADLEGRPGKPAYDKPQAKKKMLRKPLNAKLSPQAPPEEKKQAAARSAHVQSYSVAKLWDYIEKVEGVEQENTQDTVSRYPEPSDAPPSPVQEDQTLSTWPIQKDDTQDTVLRYPKPSDAPPSPVQEDQTLSTWSMQDDEEPHHIQQLLTSSWRSKVYKQIRNVLANSVWRNWILGCLVLALAITGVVRTLYRKDEVPQTQIVTEDSRPEQDRVTEPVVKETEEQTTMAQRDATGPQPDEGVSQPEIQDRPDRTAPESPDQVAEQPDALIDQKSEPEMTAVDETDEATPSGKNILPDGKTSDLLAVKDLSLWHDSLNDIYRADFTIEKNKAVNDPEPISGYAFIYLETVGNQSDKGQGLLMPRGELQSGIPIQIRKGAIFSIRNLIQMSVKAVSAIPPDDVSSGKVLVYSSEGILLLEEPFKVPIQPFFTAVEEAPAGADRKTAKAGQSISPETPSEPKPQPKAEPKPKKSYQQPIAVVPQTGIPKASTAVKKEQTSVKTSRPSDKTELAAGRQTQPRITEDTLRPVKKEKPIGKIVRTDHPDAAIWEEKSYDAAVGGNFDRAISHATKAIELDPGRVNPYVNRSWAYIEKNMLDHAIYDCRVALSLDPRNTFAYNNRGLAYQRKGQLIKAQNDYRKACELGLDLGCQNLNNIKNQSLITALIDQSRKAFTAKDWDGVIRATTKVIDVDPQNAVAYTNRSAAYAQKNYLLKALKDSNEAIKHDPKFPLAYNNRGYVFELMGNTRKAAADYLKSCSLGLDLGCKNFDKLDQ